MHVEEDHIRRYYSSGIAKKRGIIIIPTTVTLLQPVLLANGLRIDCVIISVYHLYLFMKLCFVPNDGIITGTNKNVKVARKYRRVVAWNGICKTVLKVWLQHA